MRTETCRRALLGAVAAVSLLAAGCASLTYSSPRALDGVEIKGTDGKPSRLVVADTTCYYLFWSIPLFAGDVRWNDKTNDINGGVTFFNDILDVETLQDTLHKAAAAKNCDLVDYSLLDSDATYAGFSSYAGLIGIFFGSSHLSLSAVMVPKTEGGAK